ncbi:hypothetical protein [Gluconobacter oxydans]|uniref:hypothetical protein n=1 Tax=Gluconobacter oxydans TaxID=442 RepID=UPI0026481E48|nr:hypothetical protein [Gluconobacter oxydans]WKE49532.1 hypothetical protein NUJ38_13610 [Gluconobacter oxydans]
MRVEKSTLLRVLDRLGAFATLLLPLFLVHWRGIAEAVWMAWRSDFCSGAP